MKEAKPAAMLPKPRMEEFRWMVYAVAIQDLFKTPTKSPVSFSQSLSLSLVFSHSSPLLYVVLTADLEGIRELRPADGWGSIKSCKLKLRCGYCNKVKWEEVHLGRRVPLTSRRKPIRIIKCDDCPRKAEVFIHEIYGTSEGKESSMLLLQADGMQPEDDFFLATCDFCAVDMEGTVSRSFDLVIEAGVQSGFEPDFPDGGYGGLISKMSVSFKRL